MGRPKEQPSNAGAGKTPTPATKAPEENAPQKSGYELAVENGYTGTEEQFNDPEFTGTAPVVKNGDDEAAKVEPKAPEVVKDHGKKNDVGINLLHIAHTHVSNLGFKGTAADLSDFISSFEPTSPPADGIYIVAKPFKDAAKHLNEGETPKTYEVGDDVSHLDAERLAGMLKRGIVTVTKVSE